MRRCSVHQITMKTATVLFLVQLIFGVSDAATTKKKIQLDVYCTAVSREKHYFQTCVIKKLNITNLDDNPFQITYSTFIHNTSQFMDMGTLNGTCFYGVASVSFGSLKPGDYSQSFSKSMAYKGPSRGDPEKGSPLECYGLGIHLFDASFENVSDGCVLKPLGFNISCKIDNFTLGVTVDVSLDVSEDGTYNVIGKSTITNKKYSASDECIKISGYGSDQLDMHLEENACKSVRYYMHLDPCDPSWWSYSLWKTCTKAAYGVEILFLDERYDDLVFNNPKFCESKWPVMNGCLQNDTCNRNSEYIKLQNSYNEFCTNPKNYTSAYNCMKEVLSNPRTSDTYFSKARDCSLVINAGADACTRYNREVACKAAAQYTADKDCSKFLNVYSYQRLIADRNNTRLTCQYLDPCKLDFIKEIGVCSGSHLSVSVAAVLAVFLTAIKFIKIE